MSLISNYKHYRVCRPLLEVSKEDILAYQHSNTIPYFEDDSNQDTKYVRNDIRQRILPTINRNPFLDTHHLLRLKDWHDNELQLLNEYAQHFITHFVFENKDEMGYSFSMEAYLIHFAIQKQMGNFQISDVTIIQIAYVIMAKSVDRENSITSITIEQPGTYRFNGYKLILINTYLRRHTLKIRGDVMVMCLNSTVKRA